MMANRLWMLWSEKTSSATGPPRVSALLGHVNINAVLRVLCNQRCMCYFAGDVERLLISSHVYVLDLAHGRFMEPL